MKPALLTALDCSAHVHLIVGSNPLAASRCSKSIEVGARPKVIAPRDSNVHYSLEKRIVDGEVEWLQRAFEDSDLTSLGREEVDFVVDAVFISLSGKSPLISHISSLCRRLRIPVNVADTPSLCTFTLLSTYTEGPLQIGVTTSGNGCKLAARIRREVIAALPQGLGSACGMLGALRRRIWEEDKTSFETVIEGDGICTEVEDETAGQRANFNTLINTDDVDTSRNRRMRWLAQVCEYWPLNRLAAISNADIDAIMEKYVASTEAETLESDNSFGWSNSSKAGRIVLAGSGPGNPGLLTVATRQAIEVADVILADKLVPSSVLELIPRRTPVHIARKFPGNAEAAQEELLALGLEALRKGLSVLRLKQGDPYIYGRGGEEYSFFKAAGFEPTVLPGITSALSAPLFAQIPATHRAVSDQVLICTGTGRKGAAPNPPSYNSTQTVVFLMALHRLTSLIESLVAERRNDPETANKENIDNDSIRSEFKPWPKQTPCAVVERASCPDQRIIRSTLSDICAATEEEGSRPPGLLILGKSCAVLRSLEGKRWIVEEGCSKLSNLSGSNTISASFPTE